MASLKQTEANRLNARKSTGPRSAEGKTASSMNALKSGIDAKSQIIHGERVANLENLKTEYYDRYHPTRPEQRMLVDTMIDAEWLLRRYRTVEAQIWDHTMDKSFQPDPDNPVGQAYTMREKTFARLQRRVDLAQRHFHNSLKELKRLKAEETAAQPQPLPTQNQPVSEKIGFVSQPAPPFLPTPGTKPDFPLDPTSRCWPPHHQEEQ